MLLFFHLTLYSNYLLTKKGRDLITFTPVSFNINTITPVPDIYSRLSVNVTQIELNSSNPQSKSEAHRRLMIKDKKLINNSKEADWFSL